MKINLKGLSYRRGNIYRVESKPTIEASIIKLNIQPDVFDSFDDTPKRVFSELSGMFYLCANRYFSYASSHPNAHSAATLPCEKFDGLTAHLFDIVSRQACSLSRLIGHLADLNTHSRVFIQPVADASRFDAEFSVRMNSYQTFVHSAERARNLLDQTDGFFTHTITANAPSILKSFTAVRNGFDDFRKSIRDRYIDFSEIEFAYERTDFKK